MVIMRWQLIVIVVWLFLYVKLMKYEFMILINTDIIIKTHSSEPWGQEEAACTQRTSELFIGSITANALNKLL